MKRKFQSSNDFLIKLKGGNNKNFTFLDGGTFMKGSIFPGTRIQGDDVEKIRKKILHEINPKNKPTIDNIKAWNRIDNEIYATNALTAKEYYLLYEHPIHDYLCKLFVTQNIELIKFMQERIDVETGDGLDIIISSTDYKKILVVNHDGEIYLVKSLS